MTGPVGTVLAHELAGLARAGYRVLHGSSMQVEFEVHHLVDRPGSLAGIVAQDTEGVGLAETLSVGSHGVRVVARSRIADSPGRAHRVPDTEIRLMDAGGEHATFHGVERPHLTLRHEPAAVIDGVIAIEDEPRRLLLRHGLVVLETLRHIAETAVFADAPLLSLQCPAQLPSKSSYEESGKIGGWGLALPRSASIVIRFRMALDRPRADVRLQIADRLARHCEDRGLGFWLGDTRPGYRTGNWFLIHPHDRMLARNRRRRDADGYRGANAANGCLPVTFVGPARPGATHAILSFLGQYPRNGVLACSMTSLDELTVLHLQLGVSGASRSRLAAVNRDVASFRASSADLAEVLPRIVAALDGSGPDGTAAAPVREYTERLIGRAGDYQVVVGPALPVVSDSDLRRTPIWISWRMRTSEAGLRVPLLALHRAADRLGMSPTDAVDHRSAAWDVDYLVCRRAGESVLRGRGKLGVARSLVDSRTGELRGGSARLAADLESAWRAELHAAGGTDLVSDLSVSPWEFLLSGHQ